MKTHLARIDRYSLLTALIALALVLLFAWGCVASYRDVFDERLNAKRDEAERLLWSFETNTTRLFDHADGYLRAIRAYRAEKGSSEQWQRFTREIAAPHADVFSGVVTAIDRDGWVIYQSATPAASLRSFGSMADLDHFRYFRDHPGDSFYIGPTRVGRMTGKMQFRCARPILKDGKFDGLIMLTLSPEQLIDFYGHQSLGPNSSLTVMTLEPRLIARQPAVDQAAYDRPLGDLKAQYGIDFSQPGIGRALAIGSPWENQSKRDVLYKRLAEYPVAILVGIAHADIAQELTGLRRSLGSLGIVFTLAAAIVSLMLLRIRANHRRLADAVQANEQAREQLRIAATAFDSQESMMITDADGVILQINQAFTSSTGYSAAEVIGKTPRLLKSGRHNSEFYRRMWETIRQTGGWQGEVWDRRKDGSEYPKWLTISAVKDESGRVTHYVGTHFDISERKKAEERIQELAFFDQLTGLPNRTLLLDRLKQSIVDCTRHGGHGALFFLDLDNFKTLNDTLGHDNGDDLLRQVAQRLLSCIREGDTAARLGGDEFVIMLKDLSAHKDEAANQAEAVGEKILASLNETYPLGGYAYHSTPSIGVTLFGSGNVSREELLKQADLAMYQAKAAGRNALRFFDPEMQAGVAARVALEHDLRAALRGRHFTLHYQPQIDSGGACSGAEALIRWPHAERGMVPPDVFIPVAEDTGMILALGHWVMGTACRQLALWADDPLLGKLSLAVNVSIRQLRQKDFVEQVLEILDETGADPKKLILELTESQLLTDVEDTIAKMHLLRDKGVNFALDDFGTGYSSLSYLKRLPLEKLKIDRSFVRDVLTDANDAAIAQTIVALANTLGLSVLAEGVETVEQRDFLLRHGCHAYQGYLFSRPLPLGDFEAYARRC